MKKVIFGALLIASIGTLSAFTSKTDTAVASRTSLATADSRTSLATADSRTSLATADSRTSLATADARSAKVAHDKTQLGTAD
ncbi:hypothetical protein ACPPVU_18655 [Mucilaginibacter sp. McL0603]|uniref:hypothetical protein n=1 Tax=Mucilaginibacter sp. McL0603 TaxID=3415670 RepID=UPI003CED4730